MPRAQIKAQHVFVGWLIISIIFVLFLNFKAWADETKGGYNYPVAEYQLKYRVPPAIADKLWTFIVRQYSKNSLKKLNPGFTAEAARETYVDIYFDDPSYILLRHEHSLRHRMVFTGKNIDQQFMQFKISADTRSYIRREFKFNLNNQPDKHAPDPDHPFLRLIRPSDRRLVDSVLAGNNIKSLNLRPVMEIRQHRQRLYLRERGNDLVYISLDHVYAEAPEATFIELELAINEQVYTLASPAQKQRYHALLGLIQIDLLSKFPALEQDQLPKYNKMYNQQNGQPLRPYYFNLMWLFIGLAIVAFSLFLYRTRHKANSQTPETT